MLFDFQIPLVGPKKRVAIRDAIRAHLDAARLPAGTRLPTAHVLARRFEVSYVTVHSALEDLVREGWLVRHQGKGTFVGRSFRGRARPRPLRIVMVLPPQRGIRDSSNSDVVLSFLQGATVGAAACGVDLVTLALRSFNIRAADIPAAAARIETYCGALFIGDEFAPLIQRLAGDRFPLVSIAVNPSLAVSVNYDQAAGVRLAVEHLVGHGYRRVGFFGRMNGAFSAKFDVFRKALRAAGRTWDDGLGQDCATHHETAAAEKFLARRDRPDAVFVDNYYKAEILVRAMTYRGLASPRDMAVLAYGTEHAGGIHPPLSYVRVPTEEMGEEAARTLCRLIGGKVAVRTQRTLQPRLEARPSCGCGRAAKRLVHARRCNYGGSA